MNYPRSGTFVLELLRELQRSNGAIGKLYGNDLTLGDGHTIIELTSHPYASTVSLAKMVGLDQSSVSRLLKKLIEKKILVKKVVDKKNGHFLTAKGKRVLGVMSSAAERITLGRLVNLSSDVTEHFFEMFDTLCTRMEAQPSARQEGEHPFRAIQRRIARVLGMVQGVLVHSTLATSHWHILAELIRFQDPMDLDHLARRLSLEKPIIVAALHALRNKNLIISFGSSLDSRRTLYEITPDGIAHLKKCLAPLEARIEAALNSFESQEIDAFVKHLVQFLQYTPADDVVVGLRAYRFSMVEADSERHAIRTSYIHWMVDAGAVDKIPSRLFGEQELTFALHGPDGRLVACAQALQSKQGDAAITAHASVKTLPDNVMKLFLQRCRRLLPSGDAL